MLCGIAFGSNMGDRLENFLQARAMLAQFSTLVTSSSLFQTKPVDCPPGSPPFLNAVVLIECDHSPEHLHNQTQRIEYALGRERGSLRHAPRPVDLDILFCGDVIHRTSTLSLPHPRLHLRRFVLEPLAQIAPQLILPGHEKSIAQLLAEIVSDEPPLDLYLDKW